MDNSKKLISPHVAMWLGTFVAAGSSLSLNSREEKDSKLAKRQLLSGMRLSILGPLIGLSLCKVFQRVETSGSFFPVITSSLIGSSLLKFEDEVDAVSMIIWLRVASGFWNAIGRKGSDIVTQLAIITTFHGVIFQPELAPKALVKMTRRFLTTKIFDSLVETKEKQNPKDVQKEFSLVFLRTFRGLFSYNYFLHLAAGYVGLLVRLLGSKTVHGTTNRSIVSPSFFQVFKQATKEAFILNTAVSASCALLVAGTKLTGTAKIGICCVPLPLYFCAPRVRDTLYFLFIPWCIRYLSRVNNVTENIDSRVRLLFGVYLLEGPLRGVKNEHEGYSWMISVGFGMAQKLANILFSF